MPNGYDAAGGANLTTLLLRRFYPERTDRESGVIRDWLLAHGAEYDRFTFSVRVGEGLSADPTHLPAVQRATVFSSRKRIDVLAWQGDQVTIIEVKERVTPSSLGQILTYRHLWSEEHPELPEPALTIIGRYSDDDTLRSLSAHGVTVLLYESSAPQDGA